MRLSVVFVLALALFCCASGRQAPFVTPRYGNQIQRPQLVVAPAAARSDVAQCFGLARRTRTRSMQVPVLYNSMSGQTAAVPDYLFSLDDRTIDRMETNGWEVRMTTYMMPEASYQRVPVCCPGNAGCYHNQQPMSVPITSPASRRNPCANGGVLAYRGGAQVCSCPSGFQGTWCQMPDLSRGSFPSGPVIPHGSPQNRRAQMISDAFRQAVRQAQLWKEKIFSSKQPPVVFGGRGMRNGPLLSPNDHFLTPVNKQWAQPPTTPDQALKMKIALMNLYTKQKAQQRKNQPGGVFHPMMATMLKQNGLRAGPNPYSHLSSQTPVNPQMLSMINHLQGRSGMGQQLLPVQNYVAGILGRKQVLTGPQDRTPWDMDPWDKQRGPMAGQPMMGLGRDQRDKLMALAFVQYLQNMQRRMAAGETNGNGMTTQSGVSPTINSRIPPPRQPQPLNSMTSDPAHVPGLLKTPMMDSMNDNGTPFQSDLPSATTVSPLQMTGAEKEANPANKLDNQGLNQQLSGVGPLNSQQPLSGMGPMTNQQQPPPGVGPMNDQMMQGMPGVMPTMPSQEDLQKMTECRVVLEPRITMCLKDGGHDVTLEQFMNPDFINTARGVCAASEGVGQCVMRQDHVCGEGSSMAMTRKMIDSVLQMMGMVCGQIIRLDQERGMNVPQSPAMPGVSSTQLPTVPQREPQNQPQINQENANTEMPLDEALPPTTEATEKHHTNPSGSENSVEPQRISDKFTTSKLGSDVTDTTPSKSASKSNNGHHSVELVTSGIYILGYPLWLVVTVSGVVLLLILVSLVAVCLAVRRRRRRKEVALNKELERIPEPLDPKMYALGIPPPHYATTSIKTQDELSLPPLEMVDDSDQVSVSVKEESDAGEESEEDIKKQPISDDDADDESDEKDENSDKKKKEKKENK